MNRIAKHFFRAPKTFINGKRLHRVTTHRVGAELWKFKVHWVQQSASFIKTKFLARKKACHNVHHRKKKAVTPVPMQSITKSLTQTPPKMITLELQAHQQSTGTNNLATRYYTHHTEWLGKKREMTYVHKWAQKHLWWNIYILKHLERKPFLWQSSWNAHCRLG